MTRLPTFVAGATIGAALAAYGINQAFRRSIRDGSFLRAMAAQAEQAKARAAAAAAPDEVVIP